MKRARGVPPAMAANDGKGLELLGSILAWIGWLTALVVAVLAFPAFLSGESEGRIVGMTLLGVAVGGMALAGLGHLLRAVAQLGRNVARLGALIQDRAPRP